MIFIILIFTIAITISLSYISLFNKEKNIITLKNLISSLLDNRFKNFELLINKVNKIMDYEQTFLKEIVQLRSQAQKFKQEKNIYYEYIYEQKISFLALKIELLFIDFPNLKKIEKYQEIVLEITKNEKELLDNQKTYNHLCIEYNKNKNLVYNALTTKLFKRFDKKIELWNL